MRKTKTGTRRAAPAAGRQEGQGAAPRPTTARRGHPLNQSRPEARAYPSGRNAKHKRPPGD